MSPPARWDGADLLISVRVQPRASRDELRLESGRLRLRITAPPVDGAANAHVSRYLADQFGVATGRVEIVRGLTGCEKTIRIFRPNEIPAVLGSIVDLTQQQKLLKK